LRLDLVLVEFGLHVPSLDPSMQLVQLIPALKRHVYVYAGGGDVLIAAPLLPKSGEVTSTLSVFETGTNSVVRLGWPCPQRVSLLFHQIGSPHCRHLS
jgi:hypothetical protein